MTQTDSPLKRSIGLSGTVRFLIAVGAVIAIAAAFAAGRYVLGIAVMVFLVAAVALGYWAQRNKR